MFKTIGKYGKHIRHDCVNHAIQQAKDRTKKEYCEKLGRKTWWVTIQVLEKGRWRPLLYFSVNPMGDVDFDDTWTQIGPKVLM